MDVIVNPKQTSYSGDALLTTGYGDDFTTRGNAFLFETNIIILSGGTAYVLFDYTTFVPLPGQIGQVFIYPPTFQTTAGPVTIQLYRDTEYTGGTPIVVSNPNTLVQKKVAGTTIAVGPTGSVKGTVGPSYLVGGASQGNQNGAGSTSGLSFFIRDNKKKSLVEIVNSSGSSITFHYGQILYEI